MRIGSAPKQAVVNGCQQAISQQIYPPSSLGFYAGAKKVWELFEEKIMSTLEMSVDCFSKRSRTCGPFNNCK